MQRSRFNRLNQVIFLFLLTLIFSFKTGGQILKDAETVTLIRQGIGHIYNFKFDEAEKVLDQLKVSYPGHPVINLYKGMMIYWQNFPLLPSSAERSAFEQELYRSIELSSRNIPSVEYEAEYLLANLSARGLLLLFYADNGLSSEVIPLAAETYRPLMQSFRYTSECPDLYYFTGVYNYYRDAYPRVRPIYKAVAFLFPQGNMQLGLQQLEICGKEAMALQAEAYSIISWIRMHFENDYQKSLPYCKLLYEKYPDNVFFKSMYIKNLLLLKKYNEAEEILGIESEADTNSFYKALRSFFTGIIFEKKYRNFGNAGKFYHEAIDALQPFGEYGKEYQAYAYFGLSRLGLKEDEKHQRRIYRRKALELSDFKKITFDD